MISIVISSCLNRPERKEYLVRCVDNLKTTFKNSSFEDNMEILIGFDKHGTEIDGCKCYTHNNGMGHSYNWGIQNAKNDYILQTEDDWIIEIGGGNEKELPTLDRLFYHINNRINVIKEYDGIFKFTHLGDDIFKTGKTKQELNGYSFLEWKKPEKYFINTWEIFRYSNQPHLKRKNFHDSVGYYIENSPPHEVEVDMCQKLQASDKRVFSCPFFTFIHIGQASARKA